MENVRTEEESLSPKFINFYTTEPPSAESVTSSTNSQNYTYCSPQYEEFWSGLVPDLRVSLIASTICLIDIFCSGINVIILSQKNMRSSTNTIFLAIFSLTLSSEILYLVSQLLTLCIEGFEGDSEKAEYLILINILVIAFMRGYLGRCSIWMTMTLAIWRYIAVIYPLKARFVCTMKRTKICLLTICLLNAFVMACTDFSWRVVDAHDPSIDPDRKLCGVTYCIGARSEIFHKIGAAYDILLCRLGPSIFLTFISSRLIHELRVSRKRREGMMMATHVHGHDGVNSVDTESKTDDSMCQKKKSIPHHIHSQRHERDCSVISVSTGHDKGPVEVTEKTTRMLIVVLLLFLLSAIPFTTFCIVAIALPPLFFRECGRILVVYFFTVMPLCEAANFIVFITMNVKYRTNFDGLCSKCWDKVCQYCGWHR